MIEETQVGTPAAENIAKHAWQKEEHDPRLLYPPSTITFIYLWLSVSHHNLDTFVLFIPLESSVVLKYYYHQNLLIFRICYLPQTFLLASCVLFFFWKWHLSENLIVRQKSEKDTLFKEALWEQWHDFNSKFCSVALAYVTKPLCNDHNRLSTRI